jgi:hypothetical protein
MNLRSNPKEAAFLDLQAAADWGARRTGIPFQRVSENPERVASEVRRIFGPGVGAMRSRGGPMGG